jgi:hypothetical protein
MNVVTQLHGLRDRAWLCIRERDGCAPDLLMETIMTSFLRKLACALLLSSIAPLAAAAITITVIPAEPVQNEPVYLRVKSERGDLPNASMFIYELSGVVSLPDNQLRILPGGVTGGAGDEPFDHTFYVGRLPQGDYKVILGNSTPIAEVTFAVGTSSRARTIGGFDEAASPLDHSGMWYNPVESGSSVLLVQSPRSRDLAGGVYGYDALRKPVWYTITPGVWQDAALNVYRSDLYKSSGSPIGGTFNPADFSSEKVGSVTLTFTGISSMRADFVIDGQQFTSNYVRFSF